jgi:hypothetical protein
MGGHPAGVLAIEAYSEFGKCNLQEDDRRVDVPDDEVSVFKPNSHTIDLRSGAACLTA